MKIAIRIFFWTGVTGIAMGIAQLLFGFNVLGREQGMLEILPFPGEWGIVLIIVAGILRIVRPRELQRREQTRD